MKNTYYFLPLFLFLLAQCKSSSKPGELVGMPNTTPVGKYWYLIEVGGKPYTYSQDEKKMHFRLRSDSVRGYSGCRNFAGICEFEEKTIKFTVTEKTPPCVENAEKEKVFLTTLRNSNRYEINGNNLLLKNGKNVIARFEGVLPREY